MVVVVLVVVVVVVVVVVHTHLTDAAYLLNVAASDSI